MFLDIKAIDVHAHFGEYSRQEGPALVDRFASGSMDIVASRARAAGVERTLASPLSGLLPRGRADAVSANEDALLQASGRQDLFTWVILHPRQPATFRRAAEFLRQPTCVGIKLHPEEHVYPIEEEGQALFEFAAKHDAVVLAHSGDPLSQPADLVRFADRFPNVQLILAHLGNGGGAGGDPALQVRAIRESKHGNVYVDTSSARSILPGLLEWAVGEIGSERILFGSDSPLYSVAMQRVRVDSAEISRADKQRILRDNATSLFQFEDLETGAA